MTSYKKKHSVKEAIKATHHHENSYELYNEDGFEQERQAGLSKASAKAVKKRAAVI